MSAAALPKRSTRGLRMNKLLEDEDSADEEFWNQDAFADESGDDAYESESEREDVFDSDFNESESSSDEEEVAVEKERRRPALKAPERKVVSKVVSKAPAAVKVKPEAPVKAEAGAGSTVPGSAAASTWDGGVRKSSRASVKEIRSKSELAREAAKAKPAPRRVVNPDAVRPLTQAEILADAALTEVRNLADLERIMQMEDATKKKAERVKKVFHGPVLRIKSVGGTTTMECRFGARLPPPLNGRPPKTPQPAVCAVTGKPARYRDPETKLPYHDAAAFKQLRRRAEDDDVRSDEAMDVGAGRAAGAESAGASGGDGTRTYDAVHVSGGASPHEAKVPRTATAASVAHAAKQGQRTERETAERSTGQLVVTGVHAMHE